MKKSIVFLSSLIISSTFISENIAFSKVQETPYFYKSFNSNIKKLPANFKGVNPKELYEKLSHKKNSSQKSEFETTNEYKTRLIKLNSQAIMGAISNNSLIALSGDLSTSNFDSTYNADTKVLNIKISLNSVIKEYEYELSKKSFLLNSKTSTDYYKASNSYGATVEVEKIYYWTNEVDILNWKDFIQNKEEDISTNIPMQINSAKKLKEDTDSFAFLFIGKLGSPSSFSGFRSKDPKIDDPVEILRHMEYISLNLSEIWLYQKSSGTIIAKIKPKKEIIETFKINPKTNEPIITNADVNNDNVEDYYKYVDTNDIKLSTKNINYNENNIIFDSLEPKIYHNNLDLKFNLYNDSDNILSKVSLKVLLKDKENNFSEKECQIITGNISPRENRLVRCNIQNVSNISEITNISIFDSKTPVSKITTTENKDTESNGAINIKINSKK